MTGYTLQLTNKADEDEANIYTHITDTFGQVYTEKFRSGFIQFCNVLTKQPFIGRPAKNDTTLRVFILNKQNKVVYKVEEDCITVIRILNTKTDLSSKY